MEQELAGKVAVVTGGAGASAAPRRSSSSSREPRWWSPTSRPDRGEELAGALGPSAPSGHRRGRPRRRRRPGRVSPSAGSAGSTSCSTTPGCPVRSGASCTTTSGLRPGDGGQPVRGHLRLPAPGRTWPSMAGIDHQHHRPWVRLPGVLPPSSTGPRRRPSYSSTGLLALDLAEYGIRVNCVLPATSTPASPTTISVRLSGSASPAAAGTPVDVANAVLFLAASGRRRSRDSWSRWTEGPPLGPRSCQTHTAPAQVEDGGRDVG